MKHKTKKHSAGAVCAKILLTLIILIGLVLLGGRLYFRLPVADYYKASVPAFTLPDITKGFVPQGLEYLPDTDAFLVSGYTTDNSPSPVYLVSRADSKRQKQVTLTLADGTLSTSHSGGLAAANGLLYVCDSDTDALRVFRLADLLSAEDHGTIHEVACVPLTQGSDAIGPAFVEAAPNGLIVGEFYYPKAYETLPAHYVGDHHALAVLLPYDDSEAGVSPVPAAAYSIPDKAQGICFDDEGLLYVSESWGAAFSDIEVFRPGEPTGEIDVLGVHVPLTMLDDTTRVHAVKIAPMSEEIAIAGGKLYVNCESASRKYYFGLLNAAWNVYATELGFIKGF